MIYRKVKFVIAALFAIGIGCGCTSPDYAALEQRVAHLENTVPHRKLTADSKPARKKSVISVKAPREPGKPGGGEKVSELKAEKQALAITRTAAEVRYASPKVVDQWINPDGETITRVILQNGNYTTNTIPKVAISGSIGPTKYSKKAIGDALAHMGYWSQVKTMLQETETEGGRTFWDVWVDSAWFLETDPIFTAALQAAKQTLGVTDEQLSEMLKGCVY